MAADEVGQGTKLRQGRRADKAGPYPAGWDAPVLDRGVRVSRHFDFSLLARALLIVSVGWLVTTPIGHAQEPAEDIGDPDSARYSELEKTRGAFKETYVLPGASLEGYSKIYLWDAQFEYRDVGEVRAYRSTYQRSSKTEFPVSEEGAAEFEAVVSEAFAKELEKGKRFEVVDTIGPDTIILRGALLDIVSRVPPESVGRSDVYLANIGEATLVIEVIDAETGTLLAMVSERKKIQPPGGGQIDRFSQPANRVTIAADVRRWATSAASQLRRGLDKAMQ